MHPRIHSIIWAHPAVLCVQAHTLDSLNSALFRLKPGCMWGGSVSTREPLVGCMQELCLVSAELSLAAACGLDSVSWWGAQYRQNCALHLHSGARCSPWVRTESSDAVLDSPVLGLLLLIFIPGTRIDSAHMTPHPTYSTATSVSPSSSRGDRHYMDRGGRLRAA